MASDRAGPLGGTGEASGTGPAWTGPGPDRAGAEPGEGASAATAAPDAEWLASLFRWSSEAMLVFDRDHVLVGANPAAERLFGWRAEDVIGRPVTELVDEDRLETLRRVQHLAELRLGGRGGALSDDDRVDVDWTLDRADGSAAELRITVSPVRDDDDRLLGYGALVHDVTSTRRAEALQRALASLSGTALRLRDVQAVFEAAVNTPFVTLGAEHVTLFELLQGRNELLPVAQAGWPEPELVGAFTVPVRPGSTLAQVLASGRPAGHPDLPVDPGDTMPKVVARFRVKTAAVALAPVTVGGRTWGILTVSWTDVRPVLPDELDLLQTVANVLATVIERQRNDQLQLTAERTMRLSALGQMAAGVAHDLASVLTGIEATALVEAERCSTDVEVAKQFARIRAEAQLGHDIIDEILDFARLAPLDLAPLDLGAWLADQEVALATLVSAPVTIRVEPGPGPGPRVAADACRLRRALANLVSNAADAVAGPRRLPAEIAGGDRTGGDRTVGGGEGEGGGDGGVRPDAGEVVLRVSVEHVHPGDPLVAQGVAAGEWARLEVVDHGPGMDPEVLARALEPFFSTKQHRRGTGLGLAQASSIVLRHGGQLLLSSTPWEGTTASMWLPVTTAER